MQTKIRMFSVCYLVMRFIRIHQMKKAHLKIQIKLSGNKRSKTVRYITPTRSYFFFQHLQINGKILLFSLSTEERLSCLASERARTKITPIVSPGKLPQTRIFKYISGAISKSVDNAEQQQQTTIFWLDLVC